MQIGGLTIKSCNLIYVKVLETKMYASRPKDVEKGK